MSEGTVKVCDVCHGDGEVLFVYPRPGGPDGNQVIKCPACVARPVATLVNARGEPISSNDPALICDTCGRAIWTVVPIDRDCGVNQCAGRFRVYTPSDASHAARVKRAEDDTKEVPL